MDKIQIGPKMNNQSSHLVALKNSYKIVRTSTLILALLALTSCQDSTTDANVKTDVAAAVETLNNALVDPNEELLKEISLPQLTYGHSSCVLEAP